MSKFSILTKPHALAIEEWFKNKVYHRNTDEKIDMLSLGGKKILLGISGSIAAYKSAFLVRLLIKNGFQLKVVYNPKRN